MEAKITWVHDDKTGLTIGVAKASELGANRCERCRKYTYDGHRFKLASWLCPLCSQETRKKAPGLFSDGMDELQKEFDQRNWGDAYNLVAWADANQELKELQQ